MKTTVLKSVGEETLSKPPKNNQMGLPRVVDLFCGCGGMSLGFINAGFDVVAGFDNWEPAIQVYRKNFDHPAYCMDLSDESAAIKIVSRYAPDIIIGGPPCQDFSSAGRNNYQNKRANLIGVFSKIVTTIKPMYFVLENVPRVRNADVFKTAEQDLKKAGYGITKKIINANHCGVPQLRKRLFLIGSLNSEDGFLNEIIENHFSFKPLTLRDYFGDEIDVDYYFRIPTNYNRRAVFSVDEPCVTIRAIDRPIPKNYQKHPKDPVSVNENVRAFTTQERAWIQTFPKSFLFEGAKTNLNQMIGNAVPVKLSEYVANSIKNYHYTINNSHSMESRVKA